MKLSELKPAKGAIGKKKRIARGQGSGHGGTSTRGHKGAKSRSGYKRKRNFEGGQMPLQMRLPKIGFKNPNREAYNPFNLERLQSISEKYKTDDLSLEFLIDQNIVSKSDKVKILAKGELTTALKVSAHAASASAIKAIEAAGGSFTLVK